MRQMLRSAAARFYLIRIGEVIYFNFRTYFAELRVSFISKFLSYLDHLAGESLLIFKSNDSIQCDYVMIYMCEREKIFS